VWTICLEGLA